MDYNTKNQQSFPFQQSISRSKVTVYFYISQCNREKTPFDNHTNWGKNHEQPTRMLNNFFYRYNSIFVLLSESKITYTPLYLPVLRFPFEPINQNRKEIQYKKYVIWMHNFPNHNEAKQKLIWLLINRFQMHKFMQYSCETKTIL